MRRVGLVLALVLVSLVLLASAFLVEAHIEIRGLDPELPNRAELSRALAVADAPSALHLLLTASQPGSDGSIAYPSFALEWADGRIFLIDTGMDREGARAFGRIMQRLLGSDPIEAYGSPAELLGEASGRVQGVAFTHLHNDHTGGLASLCAGRDRELLVFQTPWQADFGNYTVAPGREDLEAAVCACRERLTGGPVFSVPGFPGLVAMQAGGHTPGSSVFAARVGDATWVFAGDVTNFRSALLANEPKPAAYSLLVTPEAPQVLERLRTWLAALDAAPDFSVVVSHDAGALKPSGVQPWAAR